MLKLERENEDKIADYNRSSILSATGVEEDGDIKLLSPQSAQEIQMAI